MQDNYNHLLNKFYQIESMIKTYSTTIDKKNLEIKRLKDLTNDLKAEGLESVLIIEKLKNEIDV